MKKKIILSIDGMTCSACSNGLEKYLNKQDGIFSANVNLVMANASVEYDDKKVNLEDLNKFVANAGFKSLGEFKEIKVEKKNKNEKILLIIFTILEIVLMYISMGHMIGLPSFPLFDIHNNTNNYISVIFIITLLFIFYGFDILKNGYKNLIHNTSNMDTLVSIGVLTSFAYSIFNTYLFYNGNHHELMNLYYESAATVIYFIKIGRYIDGISKDKTKEAIKNLVTITPDVAIILKDGILKEVTLDEVNKGDVVVCKAGEKIAVDGKIIKGNGHLDETFITGESKPVNKSVGDFVIAGSMNYDGYIEYEAERIGKESTVSEIVKLVVEASNTKAPIAKIADKVSGIFVPSVIIIAILTFIIYLILGNSFNEAIMTFVTILVVACPCSLGLATPIAIVISEGLCATNGILIKKSEILETAKKVDTIVFDKTGTLTYGKLKIAEIKKFKDISDYDLIQLVASLESKSNHPIANAFKEYINENNIKLLDVTDFETLQGLGIKGIIDGKKILVGNRKLVDILETNNEYLEIENELSKDGNSILYVACENKILAIIGVNDIIREDSINLIKNLNKLNINSIMLTGDNEITANKIAKEIGIDNVISNVLPKDKANIIKELVDDNKCVIMCGDGINDSPALTNANIGISLNSGTDIAMNSSDVILTSNNLNSILSLINVSNKTIKIIKQNLFWAFFYNCLMIPVAMGLLKPLNISLNPMIASAAMVISSLTVILNTLRLKYILK